MEKQPQDFIRVAGKNFVKNGQPYWVMGTNLWYGMHLAAADSSRLIRELDRLKNLGLTNLRIMAASEGPDDAPWCVQPALQPGPGQYRQQLWEGLDFLLDEMRKRDMHAVVCLGNFWPWSGGMAQYLQWAEGSQIPYPPPAENGDWETYQLYTAGFYRSKKAKEMYWEHIVKVLERKNHCNGLWYKEDPTIMAWQLANEPRGIQNRKSYWKWVKASAKKVKSIDPNHLLSVGSEGKTSSSFACTRFKKIHKYKHIDYATAHIWVQNWEWYDPLQPKDTYPKALEKAKNYLARHLAISESIEIPLVLEEFGIARDDQSYQADSGTLWRDRFFTDIYSLLKKNKNRLQGLAGGNFWAWGGEGRPDHPQAIWKPGHALIGDPPHEYQGWYSVYDADASTLEVLKKFAANNSLQAES